MVCKICGKQFEKPMYFSPYDDICSFECFSYNYWDEIVAEKEKHIIIDGCCYSIGPEDSTSCFRGCAGRAFTIMVLGSSTIIETTNLWVQGEIPISHRDQLPDTAIFVHTENKLNSDLL